MTTSTGATTTDRAVNAKRWQGVRTGSAMVVLGLMLGVVGLAAAPADATVQQIRLHGEHGTTVVSFSQR